MNGEPRIEDASVTLTEFRMPSLGADMESGTLLEWLVAPGDTVHKGDIVAVVDTSKAAVEVECFAAGAVRDLIVQPGARVPVGAVLATIAVGAAPARAAAPRPPAVPQALTVPGRSAGPAAAPSRAEELQPAGAVTSPLVRRLAAQLHVDTATIVGTGRAGRVTHEDVLGQARQPGRAVRVRATPMARRLATELGIALSDVTGTMPDGAIAAADVRRAGAIPSATPRVGPSQPRAAKSLVESTDAMRAAIAALMTRSKREVPHYYLSDQVDLGVAMAWLHARNLVLPVPERLVPAAMLLKAAARAAREVPELNGFWVDDRFVGADSVHVGVAVSLRGGGLVAPAIHDADTLDLPDLMAAMRDLVVRARSGRLRSSELADPTITVSNLGEQGVENILGIIYPPQVALVGFGRIVDRPWAVDGLIGVRPVVTMSLSADHRATDGATGARYLRTMGRLLQRPEEL
jgi:pyruvate dehydrogenase E2 component (dihydrolipoamide acetyltransferase)